MIGGGDQQLQQQPQQSSEHAPTDRADDTSQNTSTTAAVESSAKPDIKPTTGYTSTSKQSTPHHSSSSLSSSKDQNRASAGSDVKEPTSHQHRPAHTKAGHEKYTKPPYREDRDFYESRHGKDNGGSSSSKYHKDKPLPRKDQQRSTYGDYKDSSSRSSKLDRRGGDRYGGDDAGRERSDGYRGSGSRGSSKFSSTHTRGGDADKAKTTQATGGGGAKSDAKR